MAKFIYKMQNILDIKLQLEDQAKTAYGEARIKLNQEEEILQEFEEKKIYYEQLTRSLIHLDFEELSDNKSKRVQLEYEQIDVPSRKLKLIDIKTNENAIETIKYHIKVQMVKIKQAEHELEIAREKLNKAMIERKTYEKLKENAFEEFKKEIDSTERKEIDELVSFKFNNNTGSEEDK